MCNVLTALEKQTKEGRRRRGGDLGIYDNK